MSQNHITFEVCIDSVAGALAAFRGGADRLELCSALSEGGITPSQGLVQRVLEAVDLPVMMMIRTRGGSFVYSEEEMAVMLRDVEIAKTLGVEGIVFGALRDDSAVDTGSNQQIVTAAGPLSVTFHRAFDEPHVDSVAAIGEIAALGFDRLLTSGQAASAAEGAEQIAEFDRRDSGVVIMPGAGVRPENAARILRVSGAREIHGTASRFCKKRQRRITCEQTVRAIRDQL